MRVSRDVVIAVLLLLFCGAFYAATFTIRQTSYGTVGSEIWPRMILVFLTGLTIVYLVGSLRTPPAEATESVRAPGSALGRFYATYRNPISCFAAFAVFLATLPYLGMLIGGVLFVFAALTLMGGWRPRDVGVHGLIALGTVGAMWAIFTFGLGVILPEGEILRVW